jgi:glutathione S-transferase
MRILHLASITALSLLTASGALAAEGSSTKSGKHAAVPMDLTIYHLEGRRSERIVWLCEELGLPYKLEFKQGDLAGSMQTIRDLNPLMPVAPTVRIYNQIMVESGAIIELILAREGKGRLVPAIDSPDYPYYLQWMHFAEGSLAARLVADYRVAITQGGAKPTVTPGRPRLVNGDDVVKFADDFLSRHPYFGGENFSAADIIMVFPFDFGEGVGVTDMSQYPHVAAWRDKVKARPAYQRMLAKARPNGIPGPPRKLQPPTATNP